MTGTDSWCPASKWQPSPAQGRPGCSGNTQHGPAVSPRAACLYNSLPTEGLRHRVGAAPLHRSSKESE